MRSNQYPPLRTSSIPCPRCKRLISVNASQCIHCGLRKPGLFASFPLLKGLIREEISFVDGIVIVCFLLYLLAMALDLPQALRVGGVFGTLSPSGEALYRIGMGGALSWRAGRWWTMITTLFLHGGILHILFNMLWLRRIGPWVEELFGPSRFLILYTISGLTGAVLSALAGTRYFVGASGAIFGLFGALILYGRQRGGTFGTAIFRQILIWAGFGFLFGLVMPGVDNWGHLGGFLGGLLAAGLLGYQEKKRQGLGHHLGAVFTLAVIILCFGMMLVAFFSR